VGLCFLFPEERDGRRVPCWCGSDSTVGSEAAEGGGAGGVI